MRASSLANAKVITLLNRYYVPVYVSNEDYARGGSAPAEEKAERNRIWQEAAKKGLSSGTVHVYILAPDGVVIDSLHVATATKVDETLGLLLRNVDKLKTAPGEPLVPPAPQSACPKVAGDCLVLHLTERDLRRQGGELVPVRPALGETRSGNWGAFAAEDWIVLARAEWSKLLPEKTTGVGASWELDRDVTAKVLTRFYPSTENNNVSTNRIDEQSLKATVLSIQDGVVRARLDGRLKMKHSFYHRDDDNFVDATIVGLLEFEPGKKIHSLQLATVTAIYGRTAFGVVVRSVP
jgi:hypothetical protein